MAKIKLYRREVERGLPAICMCCGDEAATERRRKFSWYPPWVNFLVLVGLLPAAIVAAILTKKMEVRVPLCTEHQNHWFSRNLIIWGGIVGLILLALLSMFVTAALDSAQPRRGGDSGLLGFVCLGLTLLGLVWLVVVCIVQSGAIKPVEITDRTITLTKVSQEFVDAIEQQDKEERVARPSRRMQAEDSDEYFDSDARRRRTRPRDEEDYED
jgi:hypothetical protein